MYGARAAAQWSLRATGGRMKLNKASWFATALAIAATVGLFALFAFGVPDSVMVGIARVTGVMSLMPQSSVPIVRVQASRWPQGPEALPKDVRRPLPDGTAMDRLRMLRERPPLLIETATITIPAGSDGLRIVTPSLSLRDMTIITNGAPLDIETETLDVANSTIRAFAEGEKDVAGRDAGQVRIVVHGVMRGLLTVDLTGEAGAAGTPGIQGQRGTPGELGQPARSGATECLVPAGRGTDGKAGGPGSPGGDAHNGGRGGTLDLTGQNPLDLAAQVQFIASGGKGGAPGPGGAGGKGGPGGRGGSPAGVCFGNGAAGQDGPVGTPGPSGAAGQDGEPGVLRVHDLGAARDP